MADGAAATAKAVEELLGLPFGDFITCVVLPQGEFAEFLHTEPRKRQETLVRLLGLSVYDVIAKEANTEARSQEQRAQVLAEQLAGYADDTAGAEQAAAERITALSAVRARVEDATPVLTAAAAELAEAEATIGRVSAERSRLTGLTAPAGSTSSPPAAPRRRPRWRRPRARSTPRSPPTPRPRGRPRPHRRVGRWNRLGATTPSGPTIAAELPGARDRQAKARESEATAGSDAAAARAAVDEARVARESAADALADARDVGSRLKAERDALHGVVAPAGLDALEGRRTSAVVAHERATAALSRHGAGRRRGAERPLSRLLIVPSCSSRLGGIIVRSSR